MATTITVHNEAHGTFVVDSMAFTSMFMAIYGDVNYYGPKPLRALLSEMTECDYFDADFATIVAALVDTEHDPSGVCVYLSQYTDEYVDGVANRFALMRHDLYPSADLSRY